MLDIIHIQLNLLRINFLITHIWFGSIWYRLLVRVVNGNLKTARLVKFLANFKGFRRFKLFCDAFYDSRIFFRK